MAQERQPQTHTQRRTHIVSYREKERFTNIARFRRKKPKLSVGGKRTELTYHTHTHVHTHTHTHTQTATHTHRHTHARKMCTCPTIQIAQMARFLPLSLRALKYGRTSKPPPHTNKQKTTDTRKQANAQNSHTRKMRNCHTLQTVHVSPLSLTFEVSTTITSEKIFRETDRRKISR